MWHCSFRIWLLCLTYQSTSTADFHQKTPQREKNHWGEPSYHLNDDVQGKHKDNACLGFRKKNGLIIIVCVIFLPTFALSSQEVQGLNNQIGPTWNSWKPHIQGAGWRCLPDLNLILQLWDQQLNVGKCCIVRTHSNQIYKNVAHTTEVLLRTSALKMLSSKLKKLTAISSTMAGPVWASSTVLQPCQKLH